MDAFNTATSKTIAATDIKYVGRDTTTYEESATAPTGAGKYTAKITVESQTAQVNYEIAKATPVAGNFTYAAPSDLTYDGTAKTATVTAKEGITGMGNVTVKYYSDEACTVEAANPTATGTYYVGITVEEGTNYSASSAVLHDESWKFTIGKATPTTDNFSYTAPSSLEYDGTAKSATVTANDGITGMGQVTVKYYSDAACTTEVENPTAAGTYYVGITVAEGDNFNAATSVLHGSSWTFTIAKATPTADNFDYDAPSSLEYDGTAKSATVNANSGATGMGNVTVKYYSDAEYTTEVQSPANVGTYYVGITAAEGDNYSAVTSVIHGASWAFTITKATPTADNFNYNAPSSLGYDGSAKSATVILNTQNGTITGMGDVTVKYYSDAACTSQVDPVNAGTYYVGVTVAEGDNFNAASSVLHNASWTFTISKADQTAPDAPTAASISTNSITLTAITNGEYSEDGTNWQTSPIFTGLTMNTPYTFYQRLAADANHNVSASSPVANISTNNHTHEWSYAASGTTITATCENTDGGHGTPVTSTLTIAAPTSLTYDGEAKAATVTGSIDGVVTPTVSYKQGSTVLADAPTNAGAYTASITLGDATVSVDYTIAKATWGSTDASKDIAAVILGMTDYTYGQSADLPTPSIPAALSGTAGAQTTFYYSTSATAETGTVWKDMTATTLRPGPYYLWAVTTSTNYTDADTPRKGCVFVVNKGTQAAPTIESITENVVTIGGYDATKTYEYAVAKTNGKPTEYTVAKPDADGKFTLYGLTGGQTYYLNLRVKATADGLYDASKAAQQSFTAANIVSVVYDANGGNGTVPATQTGADIHAASGSGLSRAGYTFQGWSTDKSAAEATIQPGDAVSQSCTLYAIWKGNAYTVRFNANGGTGTMGDESFTYGEEKALTANSFTRDGYTFVGWATTAGGTMRYTNKQSVKNLATSGSVTLYAVWAQSTYTVKVNVQQTTGNGTEEKANGATVKLMRGDAKVQEKTSGSDGVYTFTEIPAGTYNLVVTNVYDGKTRTVTEMVTVTPPDEGNTVTLNDVILPFAEVSAEVKVTGTDTPAVMVSGLNSEAETRAEDNKNVVMTMAIEEQDESSLTGTPEKQAETQTAIDAIKDNGAASGKTLSFLNIDVTKTTYATGTSISPESEIPITETNNVIRINIPYDFTGKTDVRPFRYHDGIVTPMVQDSDNDGGYKLDEANGLITLFTKQFSTYAIGYTEATAPATPTYSTGRTTSTYAVKVNLAQNGSVSASHKSAASGARVTITVKSDVGYAVDTVTVTDANSKSVSVTKVSDTTYTFTMPSSKVTVNATFTNGACPQDAACPVSKFVDADATAWYHDGVHWALDNGVMNGVGSNKFNPNGETTRAAFATMLWRMEGSPVVSGDTSFVDVTDGTWFADAVRWANASGIVTGYRDANGRGKVFNSDGAVTREQLATMLYRYAQYKKADVSANADLGSFNDAATVSGWATSAMQWAVGSGIINGIGSDLVPAGNATRAQVATMLMRYSTAK